MDKRLVARISTSGRLRHFIALASLGAAVAIAPSLDAKKPPKPVNRAEAVVLDSAGNMLGVVQFRQERESVQVTGSFDGLSPGFHGFHVHTVGMCTPPAFTSAGGHLNPDALNHPNHAGDMPALLVNPDGTADVSFQTDRFTVAELFDSDGSAVVVHANADNYANIPTDRYDPDPDATTLSTGDAGSRIGCGVIQRSGGR